MNGIHRVVASVAILLLGGCTGGGSGSGSGPRGDHHGYVVDALDLPVTAGLAGDFGRDLDADGIADNQFGNLLGAIAQLGLDLQPFADDGFYVGDAFLLVDVQSTSLDDATRAGASTWVGASSTPAACSTPGEISSCGQHLLGTATFTLAPGVSATPVEGEFVGGAFEGDGGELPLAFAIAGARVDMTLVGARMEIGGATIALVQDGVIAGSAVATEVESEFLPALQTAVMVAVDGDCTGSGGGCGCAASSTGESLLGSFDTNGDCDVTLPEIQADTLLETLMAADIDADGDGTPESLSVGVGFTAVAATFDVP